MLVVGFALVLLFAVVCGVDAVAGFIAVVVVDGVGVIVIGASDVVAAVCVVGVVLWCCCCCCCCCHCCRCG